MSSPSSPERRLGLVEAIGHAVARVVRGVAEARQWAQCKNKFQIMYPAKTTNSAQALRF